MAEMIYPTLSHWICLHCLHPRY